MVVTLLASCLASSERKRKVKRPTFWAGRAS